MDTPIVLSDLTTKIPASQTLRTVAAQQEAILEGVNTFKEISNEYGANNPEVINDGNGTDVDKSVRTKLEAINQYSDSKPYTTPE